MGMGWTESLRPNLDKQHRYAIGLVVEGGNVSPIHSCNSEIELETKYRDFYAIASEKGLSKPLPIDKVNRDKEWGKGKVFICGNLVEKVKKKSEN